MSIVMKFGGSSVASIEKIELAAKQISEAKNMYEDIVVVLSAQGDTTDKLLDKAKQAGGRINTREMDMLLCTGEQISIALMCMVLKKMGYKAVPMCGWQAGVVTESCHGIARIVSIDPKRINGELEQGSIVVVAGFQGVSPEGELTTIGRGGSDTTAVALAVALNAEKCMIFTDVNGVYSADPRVIKNAVRHDEISCDEMLELASMGAQVLHNRSVELAGKADVVIHVLKTAEGGKGTLIKRNIECGRTVTAVTSDTNIIYITARLNDNVSIADILNSLATKSVVFDMVTRTHDSICFAIKTADREAAVQALSDSGCRKSDISAQEDVSRISLVGAGIANNPIISAKLINSLTNEGIDAIALTLSEIRASVIVSRGKRLEALKAIHDCFFCEAV